MKKEHEYEAVVCFGTGCNTGMARVDCAELDCDWTTEDGRDELSAIAYNLHCRYPQIVHVQFMLGPDKVGEMMFVPAEGRLH